MNSLADRLTRTASGARGFLKGKSRRQVARFIFSKQNSDGGFRGKSVESDLYYTMFAVAGLKALGAPIPVWRLWKYLRQFADGEKLDLVHLTCLIRLRTAFPMTGKTRRRFFRTLETRRAESAYDLFLKQLAGDCLGAARLPSAPRPISFSDPTPNLAAAVLVNPLPDQAVAKILFDRICPSGGFSATDYLGTADLLSTATALLALRTLRADIDLIRRPCLEYIETLWRDSGGFAGHVADELEDVEYTFYALLSIGCLMQS
jgi:prenyltransferase beta subunit